MSCRSGVLKGKRGSGTDLGCESPRLGWVDAIAVICGKGAAKACRRVSTAESGRNKSSGVCFLGYPEPGRMEKPVWFERREPQRRLGVSHYLAVLGKKCLGWPTRHLQRPPSGGQIESDFSDTGCNFNDTGCLREGASLAADGQGRTHCWERLSTNPSNIVSEGCWEMADHIGQPCQDDQMQPDKDCGMASPRSDTTHG